MINMNYSLPVECYKVVGVVSVLGLSLLMTTDYVSKTTSPLGLDLTFSWKFNYTLLTHYMALTSGIFPTMHLIIHQFNDIFCCFKNSRRRRGEPR